MAPATAGHCPMLQDEEKTQIQARSASLVATGLAGEVKGRKRPLFTEASLCWGKVCPLPSSPTLDLGWMKEGIVCRWMVPLSGSLRLGVA